MANRIADLRAAQGETLEGVAAWCGVSATTVNRWERHKAGVPDQHKLTLARRFGVTVPWLMGWQDGEAGDGPCEARAANG